MKDQPRPVKQQKMADRKDRNMSDQNTERVGHLGTEQARTLAMMRACPVPWCLHARMAAGLLRRGLIAQSGVCCKEHNDPMFVLVQEKDSAP